MLLFVFLAIIFGLNSSAASYSFAGKTYKVVFKGAVYMNQFISDTEMKYTGIAGMDQGASETVKITYDKIYDKIFKIQWQEADRIIVNHIEDFRNGISYASIVLPDGELVLQKGTIGRICKALVPGSINLPNADNFSLDPENPSYTFVGDTYKVQFENGDTYLNEFLSNTQLRYTALSRDKIGRSEVVDYIVTQITEDIFKINWIEENGIKFVQVNDFGEGKAWVSLITPDLELINEKGTLQKQ